MTGNRVLALLLAAGAALAGHGSLVWADDADGDNAQPVCIKEVNGELQAFPGPCPDPLTPVDTSDSRGIQSAPGASTGIQAPGNLRVRELVIQIAQNSSEEASLASFESLVSLGASVVTSLSRIFRDPAEDPSVRWVSGRALGRIPHPESLAALTGGLKDPVPTVRIAAVRGIEDQGNRSAMPNLIRALDDRSALVRAAVLDAIGTLGTTLDVPVVARELEASRNFIKDQGLFVRVHAAVALGRLGGPQAIEALIEIADDPDPATRDAAQAALLRLTGLDAVPPGAGSIASRWRTWWVRPR